MRGQIFAHIKRHFESLMFTTCPSSHLVGLVCLYNLINIDSGYFSLHLFLHQISGIMVKSTTAADLQLCLRGEDKEEVFDCTLSFNGSHIIVLALIVSCDGA